MVFVAGSSESTWKKGSIRILWKQLLAYICSMHMQACHDHQRNSVHVIISLPRFDAANFGYIHKLLGMIRSNGDSKRKENGT